MNDLEKLFIIFLSACLMELCITSKKSYTVIQRVFHRVTLSIELILYKSYLSTKYFSKTSIIFSLNIGLEIKSLKPAAMNFSLSPGNT